MEKKISFIALVVALIALLAALMPAHEKTASAEKQETTYDRVMRTRTIRCGYAVWNPVLFKDLKTGEVKGISRDIMDEIGKNLSLHIEWTEETGWGTIVEGLATRRYDMICNGLGIIGTRGRAINFSSPFLYGSMYLVVRADDNRIQKNEDADNPDITVSILEGEAFSFLAPKRFPKAVIKALPQMTDYSGVFQDVESKKSDVTGVCYSDFILYDKANPGKLKVIDVRNPLHTYPISFGLPQGDVAMKTMIDAALDELVLGGMVERTLRAHTTSPLEFLLPAKPYAVPLS
jgi:polar amino acid transport system substrate-binding protein